MLSLILPWFLKRQLLRLIGYQLHPTSYIGLSLVMPDHLIMEAHSRIGHLTVCKGLGLIHLEERATIGNLNWITGYPRDGTKHFINQERTPELIVAQQAAITNRHLIDCTNSVHIGKFTIVAGFQSQFITHSIDLKESKQASKPITIGSYCFVGSNSVILGGSHLPDYSVLGANSLLNKYFEEPYKLYGGVPAKCLKDLPADWQFFRRSTGFVY